MDKTYTLSKEEIKKRREGIKRATLFTIATMCFLILGFAMYVNKQAFVLSPDTLKMVNYASGAIVLLAIPFLLGVVGATARLLLEKTTGEQAINIALASGLMATFSWVGIKSGILIAIITPHLEEKGLTIQPVEPNESGFYTMALVAILVGMFSSNIYIFLDKQAERIAANETNEKDEKHEV